LSVVPQPAQSKRTVSGGPEPSKWLESETVTSVSELHSGQRKRVMRHHRAGV
jgi:hypothetical protein